MIEVFKTNINSIHQSTEIRKEINFLFPEAIVFIDTNDCDKILKVKSTPEVIEKIENLIISKGYFCEALAN